MGQREERNVRRQGHTECAGAAHAQDEDLHGHNSGALSAVDAAVDSEKFREAFLVGELGLVD